MNRGRGAHGMMVDVPSGMMTSDDPRFIEFLDGYITCALWCGVIDERTICTECEGDGCEDCDGTGKRPETFELYSGGDLDESDLTDAARAEITRDAVDFFKSNLGTMIASTLTMEQCGHDFWLTRNRHGAGFWDRKSRGAQADLALDRLTDAAHAYGECNLGLDDSGKVGIL